MVAAQIHYEVFGRRKPGSGWTLEMATEDRRAAVQAAEDMMSEGFAAARVNKESLDTDTREFASLAILNLGQAEVAKKRPARENADPMCVQPQDLYTLHARERIGRLLEDWLERKRVTPFELLHRHDLVEQLEASGRELQHAIQKICVPEASERGLNVHELIRTFQGLVDRTIARLMKDHRRGVHVDLWRESFTAAAERLHREPDGGYYLGVGVAGQIAGAASWTEKVEILLNLADAAPAAGPARKFALGLLEQPLAEVLGAKAGLDNLIGKDLDLGGELAALTRLTAGAIVERLIQVEASVARAMPPLEPTAARLARRLGDEGFEEVRTALGKRILRQLNGPRRLRPDDAAGEIDILRALAMSLTAASGKLLPLEEVQAAFSVRSRMLVTSDFVEAYLGHDHSALEEAQALVLLAENVIGGANKRQASRWLSGVIVSLRFESELRSNGGEGVAGRLAKLATLQRQVGRCGLAPEDCAQLQKRLGDLGGQLETESRLTASLARAAVPPLQRLTLLLRLATGEAAPAGPAADRAREEALKLIRDPAARAELTAAAPDQIEAVRALFQQAGLAA
jgi:hypothetical protein